MVTEVTLETLGFATSTDATYTEFLRTLRRARVPIREVVSGESLVLGQDQDGVKIYASIMFPASQAEFVYSKASPPSIVLDLLYSSTQIVVAGDITPKIQRHIMGHSSSTGSVDVLIVSHSASADHFNQDFLDMLDPEYLVYSQSVSRSSGNAVVPYERRFNTKEKTIKIVSDGSSVDIERVDN